jgi:glycosyltransferase involved in cell wall biosynthesis
VTFRHDVVIALNYYSPYVSGLTDVAKTVAEELAARGFNVTVVACQHDAVLPRDEVLNGVRVIRTPVIARIGKGLISPAFISRVIREGRAARLLNLHLPMVESGAIALGIGKVPTAVTYQCDVSLPPGLFNRLQSWIMDLSNRIALKRATAVIPSSYDYADHSRLRKVMDPARTIAIAPPTKFRGGGAPTFRRTTGLHVGFLGRLVEEKGVEYLVEAFRSLDDPDARLLIAGDYLRIAGGSTVEVIRKHIGNDPRIELLGFLSEDELADFYRSIDVFVLPSVNAFEAFGIVQVEAMRTGVAAIASDLPGVRQPVLLTGLGLIARPRDSADIAAKLRQLVATPPDAVQGSRLADKLYSTETTFANYLSLFERIMLRKDFDH